MRDHAPDHPLTPDELLERYHRYPDHHEGSFARGLQVALIMSALMWIIIAMIAIATFHIASRDGARPTACAGFSAAECAAAVVEARQ